MSKQDKNDSLCYAVNPQQDSPAQLPVQSPRYLCTISSLQQSSVWKTVGFTTVQDIIMLIANVKLFKYVHLPSIEHFEFFLKTCIGLSPGSKLSTIRGFVSECQVTSPTENTGKLGN